MLDKQKESVYCYIHRYIQSKDGFSMRTELYIQIDPLSEVALYEQIESYKKGFEDSSNIP